MKVKHLIRELQKCDPEAEVLTEGGYDNGYTCHVSTYESCMSVFLHRSDHALDESSVCWNYRNDDDTEWPLPPRVATSRSTITPLQLSVEFTVDRPGDYTVHVNEKMEGTISY